MLVSFLFFPWVCPGISVIVPCLQEFLSCQKQKVKNYMVVLCALLFFLSFSDWITIFLLNFVETIIVREEGGAEGGRYYPHTPKFWVPTSNLLIPQNYPLFLCSHPISFSSATARRPPPSVSSLQSWTFEQIWEIIYVTSIKLKLILK